jgi:hypothetical protein
LAAQKLVQPHVPKGNEQHHYQSGTKRTAILDSGAKESLLHHKKSAASKKNPNPKQKKRRCYEEGAKSTYKARGTKVFCEVVGCTKGARPGPTQKCISHSGGKRCALR